MRQEGINVHGLKLFVYTFSGFCASIAGILLSAQLDTVHPIQGDPYLLDTIAACVIGGVSLAEVRAAWLWQSRALSSSARCEMCSIS